MPPTDAAFTIQPDSSALGTFHEDTLQAELSDLSKILLSYDLTESCSPDRNIVVKPMDTTEVPVRLVDIRLRFVLVDTSAATRRMPESEPQIGSAPLTRRLTAC